MKVLRRLFDPEPPFPRWDSRFDELANWNSLKSRASGSQWSTLHSAGEREFAQRDAQAIVASRPADYVERMRLLQEEYDAQTEAHLAAVRAWQDRTR